ncbi:MAG: hypothetical protein LKH27_08160 [Prevotella sp.]|jgi:hypothetical protein|nr:hypothetical protein [Prevotella sp.]MCH3993028.1 hypothetical protein [Prevotella sp.]MCI1474371.1 hypothetical protein [Prevotella sp.]MCI1596073.1 hypothetical protein [Prevotella sp.]
MKDFDVDYCKDCAWYKSSDDESGECKLQQIIVYGDEEACVDFKNDEYEE